MEQVEKRPNVEFESAIVNRYGAKTVFLSTRFDFIEKAKPSFKESLVSLVNAYGFMAIIVGDSLSMRHFTDRDNSGRSVEYVVTERIKHADAFLQIYPRLSDKEIEKERDWLLFELGLARGQQIPYEICIDEKYINDYPNNIIEGKDCIDSIHLGHYGNNEKVERQLLYSLISVIMTGYDKDVG